MFHVESSDGVAVAVHELGGAPDAPPLLLSHANGFHAHCFEPVAARLASHFRVFALDHRGHGRTEAPPRWEVDWRGFGDDVLAVADAIAPDGGLVGVGHSMGGAALLLAAHRRPDRFERLVLFEPIAIPDSAPLVDMTTHPIVVGAQRRRRVFASFEDAIENYRDKPPLSEMTPEVLRAYVEHGFRPTTVDGVDAVELICRPETEAGIFLTSRRNGVWERLPEITVPTTVVAGHLDEEQPSGRCPAIADRLPRSRFVLLPHMGHLGPFSHPVEFADLVLTELGVASDAP